MKKQVIMSSLSVEQIRKIIENQTQSSLFSAFHKDNTFRLYKTLSKKPYGYFYFRIDGEIIPNDRTPRIKYTLRPVLAVTLTSIVLLYSLLDGIISLLTGNDSSLYVVLGLLFNVVFNTLVLTQMKEHNSWFKSLLGDSRTGDGSKPLKK